MKIFFSGIGGSGVSAIATFMADKGHSVVGSDRAFDRHPGHPLCSVLKAKGISVVPQDGSGIDRSFDLVVFSTAIEPDRPEVLKAKTLEIPMKTRPEFLAEIVSRYRTIGVAGTSGKSTTSGLLAFLMQGLGLTPNLIGGGRVKQFRTETNPGNYLTGESDWLVIEACESDGSIIDYRPLHTVLLNLDLDHHSVEETAGMFGELIKNTEGRIVMNADDPNLRRMDIARAVGFSIDRPSAYKAEEVVYRPFGADFVIASSPGCPSSPPARARMRAMRFSLGLPGRHNLSNALSCIALLSEIGIDPGEISALLRDFRGIERRFDILLDDGRSLVIDDYAHNPHKIAALMETAGRLRDRVCYIFQPHGFGPTKMMKKEYVAVFREKLRTSDHLILLPIFYEGGTAAKDISSRDLAELIGAEGRSVETVEQREAVLERLEQWDACVVFGARDETLSDFAKEIAERLRRD
ncbi:MAG: Mur ligase domain-containing protein [Nitrospirae bacterium]|nr:Mur ligase domain-containing protein [Nitrospirota bacterium]